ncbi:hypothetical protein [Haliangium sp.]|uniref:hypothetical protein n=1 Tax=Haliangium sp. TaxID=2663208 RepID=UPI003D0DBAED
MSTSALSTPPPDDDGDAAGARRRPTEETLSLLAEARTEVERARAEHSAFASVFRVPEHEYLSMLVAVREAAAAGLDDDAIATCCDAIRPTLSQMSGSDFFTTGPRRDLLLIERYLREDRVEDALEFIAEMSRTRPWLTIAGLVFLCVATLVFWLLRR